MKITVIKGKDISSKKIKEIKEIWDDAFGGTHLTVRKSFSNNIFFILEDSKNMILAVGRLIPIKIDFLNTNYNIFGSADLVSVVKGKGYGKKIKKAQIKYIKDKTMIGFCERKNSPFYRKCGLKIAENLVKRFIYIDSKGKEIKNTLDNDLLYLNGKDNFMKKVLNSNEKVIIPIIHW